MTDVQSSNSLFDMVWQEDGSVTFVANNGKYVAAKKSGHLFANSDKVDDMEKFYFFLINRRSLVLKCEQGFVGYKSSTSSKLESNKASYETITMERDEKGVCYFRGAANHKYWTVSEDGSIAVESDKPQGFYIELREPCKLCLKTTDGCYLVADKNGAFKVNGTDPNSATLWEY
ncbi:protein singed-like [Limulus polyphemus]|uniref:Protein singed-like n=1 Tax=Limulus polyphemus TaxID=6850 RepID=A0ABM1C199_LIMPO|nr:protein singed-like [Limulus polyphemus]